MSSRKNRLSSANLGLLTASKPPPVVRLPPKSNLERGLLHGAQIAIIFLGFVGLVFALSVAQLILAPILLAIVVGLMLSPLATRLEAHGWPPPLAALAMVLLFLSIVSLFLLAVAAPLSVWIDRFPDIWRSLQSQAARWREPIETLRTLREQFREISGGSGGLPVQMDQGLEVGSVAAFAPALIGQILLFFASLFFFIGTRHQTRGAILNLCLDRRLRWRVAHIFRDVEWMVSRYLLSITVINICEGTAVGIGLWLAGVPSAILWAGLAIVTNFVLFLGPVVMVAVLLAVGLTEFDSLGMSLLPALIYLGINMIEAQFVTPVVIGRTMTLNPLYILLSLAFWIWLWGPFGGFVAIPVLLTLYAIMRNILPGLDRPVGLDRAKYASDTR